MHCGGTETKLVVRHYFKTHSKYISKAEFPLLKCTMSFKTIRCRFLHFCIDVKIVVGIVI